MDGFKVFSMVVDNIHFLDSLNFLPMSLKSLSKSFELSSKKGFYHFFYAVSNLDYEAPYHEPSYYGADFLSDYEGSEFLAWLEEQKGNAFNNKAELLAYFMDDVNALRQHAVHSGICF
jgi:hypothetical protein